MKLRGFRVELGEIEQVIHDCPGVTSNIVVAVENTWLVAYFTASRSIEQDELSAFCAERLTDYMVPNLFVQLKTMPLTANAKIDKKALPEPDMSLLKTTYAAPRNEQEEQLCAMFQKALKIDQVGIDDDFFALGGTSLTASKVAIMCFNAQLPVVYSDVFTYKTVRALGDNVLGESIAEEDKNAAATTDLATDATTSAAASKPQQPAIESLLSVTTDTATDQDPVVDAIETYDYSAINALLASNASKYVNEVFNEGLGDILLPGATGYLGIHVLKEFLDHHEGRAWCLVRKGGFESLERRLSSLLMYYFEKPYTELMGERILCIEADITNETDVERLSHLPFRTVVNCAASVKHFAAGNELVGPNVVGVQNLV